MKKFFTLIAVALVAVGANAQNFKPAVELITNGSIAYQRSACKTGEFDKYKAENLVNFVSREWNTGVQTNATSRVVVDPAELGAWNADEEGRNNINYCLEVVSRDVTDAEGNLIPGIGYQGNEITEAQDWDTQFFVVLPRAMKDGDKFKFSMRIKAVNPETIDSQTHKGSPGAYIHWAFVGSPAVTEDWQDYTYEGTISGSQNEGDIIAFNMAKLRKANKYYIDDVSFIYEEQIVEEVSEWTDIIINGDLEGTDNKCFYTTQPGVGGPFQAYISDGLGVDGSRGIIVESADNPTQDWDTQFFIRLPQALPAGTQYKVSFDYKANKAGSADTQAHTEPGSYIHYVGIGSPSFTTDWQTYTAEGKVSSDQSKDGQLMHSIAFNLAKFKEANIYFFDNIKFEIPSDAVVEPDFPEENQLPTGINTAKVKAAKSIFNVAGQQMKSLQKGLNIVNGEKVYIK